MLKFSAKLHIILFLLVCSAFSHAAQDVLSQEEISLNLPVDPYGKLEPMRLNPYFCPANQPKLLWKDILEMGRHFFIQAVTTDIEGKLEFHYNNKKLENDPRRVVTYKIQFRNGKPYVNKLVWNQHTPQLSDSTPSFGPRFAPQPPYTMPPADPYGHPLSVSRSAFYQPCLPVCRLLPVVPMPVVPMPVVPMPVVPIPVVPIPVVPMPVVPMPLSLYDATPYETPPTDPYGYPFVEVTGSYPSEYQLREFSIMPASDRSMSPTAPMPAPVVPESSPVDPVNPPAIVSPAASPSAPPSPALPVPTPSSVMAETQEQDALLATPPSSVTASSITPVPVAPESSPVDPVNPPVIIATPAASPSTTISPALPVATPSSVTAEMQEQDALLATPPSSVTASSIAPAPVALETSPTPAPVVPTPKSILRDTTSTQENQTKKRGKVTFSFPTDSSPAAAPMEKEPSTANSRFTSDDFPALPVRTVTILKRKDTPPASVQDKHPKSKTPAPTPSSLQTESKSAPILSSSKAASLTPASPQTPPVHAQKSTPQPAKDSSGTTSTRKEAPSAHAKKSVPQPVTIKPMPEARAVVAVKPALPTPPTAVEPTPPTPSVPVTPVPTLATPAPATRPQTENDFFEAPTPSGPIIGRQKPDADGSKQEREIERLRRKQAHAAKIADTEARETARTKTKKFIKANDYKSLEAYLAKCKIESLQREGVLTSIASLPSGVPIDEVQWLSGYVQELLAKDLGNTPLTDQEKDLCRKFLERAVPDLVPGKDDLVPAAEYGDTTRQADPSQSASATELSAAPADCTAIASHSDVQADDFFASLRAAINAYKEAFLAKPENIIPVIQRLKLTPEQETPAWIAFFETPLTEDSKFIHNLYIYFSKFQLDEVLESVIKAGYKDQYYKTKLEDLKRKRLEWDDLLKSETPGNDRCEGNRFIMPIINATMFYLINKKSGSSYESYVKEIYDLLKTTSDEELELLQIALFTHGENLLNDLKRMIAANQQGIKKEILKMLFSNKFELPIADAVAYYSEEARSKKEKKAAVTAIVSLAEDISHSAQTALSTTVLFAQIEHFMRALKIHGSLVHIEVMAGILKSTKILDGIKPVFQRAQKIIFKG